MKRRGHSFKYEGENLPIEPKDPQNQTISQYYHDGDGRRVKKIVPATGETTIFVYDASGRLVAEYSTIVANSADAKVAYLTNDHLGSPRINTDANGAVTARHDYHPFGEEIGTLAAVPGSPQPRTATLGYTTDTIRQKFTGYERDDETDLDFAQARMYSKNHGRFASVDPNLESTKLEMPQSWNRYTYVLSNPLVYIDPNGELWVASGNKDNPFQWVDKCGEGQICFEVIAVGIGNNLRVYGSNNAYDITDYQANENGVINVRELSRHHNARFIVADGQNVPEEYLNIDAAMNLFNAAYDYNKLYPNDEKLVFTAGSESTGKPGMCGKRPCHTGHKGDDIDLRYMDKNGKPIRGNNAVEKADVERTKTLIDLFTGRIGFSGNRNEVYTGDQSKFGLPPIPPRTEKKHTNHLHVGMQEVSTFRARTKRR